MHFVLITMLQNCQSLIVIVLLVSDDSDIAINLAVAIVLRTGLHAVSGHAPIEKQNARSGYNSMPDRALLIMLFRTTRGEVRSPVRLPLELGAIRFLREYPPQAAHLLHLYHLPRKNR